jgi:putative transposase
VLLSLATGALLDMAMGPYQGKETGETALLRELLDSLDSGDVLLADRYYCSYWMVALAQACGVDVVFRMHQRRDYDFGKGQRLGPDDHLVVWHKPQRPDWMDAETYAEAPDTLQVREVRVEVATAGFRTKELVIVTTLTDPADVSAEELGDLYHERWHAELDIRAIKQSLRMEHLRCQSPFMVEKEVWAHFLGYNLVRKVSAQAAMKKGLAPRQISFSATQQALNALRSQLTLAGRTEQLRQALQVLATLGKVQVGKRPDRYEPRAVKRRPKPYERLTKPRAQARQEILQGQRR